MNNISGKYQGNLSEEDAQCSTSPLDTRDIVLSLDSEGDNLADELEVSEGFLGFRVRAGARANIKKFTAHNVKNDIMQLWNGGVSVGHFYARHCLPVKYCNENHPDIFQAFAKQGKAPFHMQKVFSDLYIGSADVLIDCHDLGDGYEDKKNGFMFTELCEYRNISLFTNGLTFNTNSKAPYFVDMTSGQNVIIGSKENPIDPKKVSNKAIRIGGQGGTKKNPPECENITIHAYEGLKVVLGESAKKNTTIIEYKKKKPVVVTETQKQPPKVQAMNKRTMSEEGLRTLVESEGSEANQYLDTANFWTIGVGHKILPEEQLSGKIELASGRIIDIRSAITNEEITALLSDDLTNFCDAVNQFVKPEITQGQFDALVHFSFNVGVTAFKNSTLLKRINSCSFDEVPEQIRRWNKITIPSGEKRISEGLANRRKVECRMWIEGSNEQSNDFELIDLIEPELVEEIELPELEHDYPVATERELRGIDKPQKKIWFSRIFGGTGIGGGSILGSGGILFYLQEKVSSLTSSVINDPTSASESLATTAESAVQTFQDVTVNAERLIEATSSLQSWFMWGAILLAVGFAAVAFALYARLDDRAKGIN